MEQVSHWIIELNRSDHTSFAIFTVIVMVGLGCLLAGLLEIIFSVIGIKADERGKPSSITGNLAEKTERKKS